MREEQGDQGHPGEYTLTAPEAFLLDLDGTLYTGSGPVAGAPEALHRLRERKIPFRLVTNTTSRSRALIVQRLASYGMNVSTEEVFSATLAAAQVIKEARYRVVAPFLPEPALDDLADLDLCGGTSGVPAKGAAEAVVVGDLGEAWTYALLQEAFEHLMSGAVLIAASRDRYWLKDNRLALDAGAFVAGLEFAVGKAAIVAGKPGAAFYSAAVRSIAMEAGPSVAMVGDDLWSDIQGAQRAGLQGWLVQTGKYREAALAETGIRPDRILQSIAALA